MTQTVEKQESIPWSMTYAVESEITPDTTMSGGTVTGTTTNWDTDDANADDYTPDDPGPPFPPNP